MKTASWTIHIALLALFVSTSGQSLFGQTQLVSLGLSDFELNADGWRGTNDANGPETLTYNLGGASSNSLGYISISETAGDSATMYFVAPAKFLGDKHAAYNGFLRFKFKQSATDSFGGAADFVLLGTSDLILSFTLRTVPGTIWQSFEVPLNENVGWRNITSHRFATREDFHAVLRAVTKLWIRGEFSSHNFDQSDLDDVELLGQPSGPTQPALTLATYAGITIEGEVGASYRLEYRGVLGTTTNWQRLADVILPSNPYLFIDQTSPSATCRFYRALLLNP